MHYATGICEHAHDLTAIVDPKGCGQHGAGDIDLCEGQCFWSCFRCFGAGFLRCKGDRWGDQEAGRSHIIQALCTRSSKCFSSSCSSFSLLLLFTFWIGFGSKRWRISCLVNQTSRRIGLRFTGQIQQNSPRRAPPQGS